MTMTDRKRNSTMTIRLTNDEKCVIAAKARGRSQSISEYVLGVLLLDESEPIKRCQLIMRQMKLITDKLDGVSEQLKKQEAKSVDFQDIIDMQNELKNQMLALSARM